MLTSWSEKSMNIWLTMGTFHLPKLSKFRTNGICLNQIWTFCTIFVQIEHYSPENVKNLIGLDVTNKYGMEILEIRVTSDYFKWLERVIYITRNLSWPWWKRKVLFSKKLQVFISATLKFLSRNFIRWERFWGVFPR